MLEKPPIDDEQVVTLLEREYGLTVARVDFLPLGADPNAAVYRVTAHDTTPYFFKLKSGPFEETSVTLPRFLADCGIEHIIVPLATRNGQLWSQLESYKTILYPFINGHNGYERTLSDRQWVEFGATLKQIHTVELPPALQARIPRETYSAQWRASLVESMPRAERGPFDDPLAGQLAAFLNARRDQVLDLVTRTDRLAQALVTSTPALTLCHSDLHAGNLLLGAHDGFYIVDWDSPILALKERDLMFVGGAQFGAARTPQQEQDLFYRGYGETTINPSALAYYRYERIIEDLAIECDQIWSSAQASPDRDQAFEWLKSNFQPNNTLDNAYRSDQTR